jgi:hypothetical protein
MQLIYSLKITLASLRNKARISMSKNQTKVRILFPPILKSNIEMSNRKSIFECEYKYEESNQKRVND